MVTVSSIKRLVYLVHRWTGVAACAVMALWVVSGVVMLYVGYPKLTPAEHVQPLPVLGAACCVPVEAALAHSRAPASVQQITLTSIGGQPHYVLTQAPAQMATQMHAQAQGQGALLVVDARSGLPAARVDMAAALASARAFLPGHAAAYAGSTTDDRWTHSGKLDAHRPLFKVQMDDPAATLLYVSSATGQVVLDAPRAQRYWNVVGAWLHWVYLFRDGSRDAFWSWLVIGLSAVGTVSAVSGALAGIWRWRFSGAYKSGSRTPYRAFQMRWHHLTGLAFGAILITWIFSGLMSMNPLGVFDPAGERPNRAAFSQGAPGVLRPALPVGAALALLRDQGFNASELEWRVLGGQPYLLARSAAGSTRLVMAAGADGPAGAAFVVRARWPDSVLAAAGARLMHAGVDSAQTLHHYDSFYYKRQAQSMYGAAERRLPVLRLDFKDPGATAVYLDLYSGDLALSADRSQRTGRWLFQLLHSWDFPLMLRFAGAREVLLVLLSLGALAITVTGTVIGCRRLAAHLRGRLAAGHARNPRPT